MGGDDCAQDDVAGCAQVADSMVSWEGVAFGELLGLRMDHTRAEEDGELVDTVTVLLPYQSSNSVISNQVFSLNTFKQNTRSHIKMTRCY